MLKTDEHRRAPTGHVCPSHLTPLLSFQGLSWPRQLLASGAGVGKRGQGGIWVLRSEPGLVLTFGGGVSVTLGCPLGKVCLWTGLLGVLASGTASIGADGQPWQVGAGWSPLTALPTCHPPARVTGCLTH